MNAIELLEQDHRTVERLFADFESDPGEKRQEILAKIIRELSIHSAIEETHLYPRIRTVTADGERYADESVQAHQTMKETLARLDDRLDAADTADVAEQVSALRAQTAQHIREEETEVFAAYEEVATTRGIRALGHALAKAKGSAPTRPHPKQPAANAFTSWANGVLDRARDAIGRRPR